MGNDYPLEPSLAETIDIAIRLHGDQTDFGGRPYREHLLAVLGNIPPWANEIQQKGAVLHDTIEDVILFKGTPQERKFTADDLRALHFREEIVTVVEILTRENAPGSSYRGMSAEERHAKSELDYLAKIQLIIDTGNVDAMEIKRADNKHNADPARDRWISEPAGLERAARLRRRYNKSILMLDAAIDAATAAPVY